MEAMRRGLQSGLSSSATTASSAGMPRVVHTGRGSWGCTSAIIAVSTLHPGAFHRLLAVGHVICIAERFLQLGYLLMSCDAVRQHVAGLCSLQAGICPCIVTPAPSVAMQDPALAGLHGSSQHLGHPT